MITGQSAPIGIPWGLTMKAELGTAQACHMVASAVSFDSVVALGTVDIAELLLDCLHLLVHSTLVFGSAVPKLTTGTMIGLLAGRTSQRSLDTPLGMV